MRPGEHFRPALSRFFRDRKKHNLVGVAGVMIFFSLLLLSAASNAAFAAGALTASAKLTSPNAEKRAEYGHSIAADDGYLVVGQPGESVNGKVSAGRAYVYSAISGKLLYTLTSPKPELEVEFGQHVAVNGNLVVVAEHEGTADKIAKAGDVYVYEASSGKLLRTLTSPKPEESGFFGISVAVSGEYVLVGAREAFDGYTESGRAYVFNASSGKLLHTLSSPTPRADGNFGTLSVAISSEYVVVGALNELGGGRRGGGDAYVYSTSSGSLLHTLTSPNPVEYGYFGDAVAISGEDVVVGAYEETVAGVAKVGDAYVYSASSGALLHTITSPAKPEFGSGFPTSIATSGEDVVLGEERGSSDGHVDAGNAYVYNTSGELMFTLTSPTPQAHKVPDGEEYGGEFGDSVAINGEHVFVGAKFETSDGLASAGNVYAFNLTPTSEFTAPPETGKPAPKKKGKAKITKVTVSADTVKVELSCPKGAGACAKTNVKVTVTAHLKQRGRTIAKSLVVASGGVSLKSGAKKTLKLTLSSAGKALLSKHPKTKALIVVTEGTVKVASRTLTL